MGAPRFPVLKRGVLRTTGRDLDRVPALAPEGMTSIRTGPLADTVVVLDGYQVLAVKENSTRRLFSAVPLHLRTLNYAC